MKYKVTKTGDNCDTFQERTEKFEDLGSSIVGIAINYDKQHKNIQGYEDCRYRITFKDGLKRAKTIMRLSSLKGDFDGFDNWLDFAREIFNGEEEKEIKYSQEENAFGRCEHCKKYLGIDDVETKYRKTGSCECDDDHYQVCGFCGKEIEEI